jgi:hypothetical protein
MGDFKDMDLRHWFAGQALEGLLANEHYPSQGSGEPFEQFTARLSDTAFRIADAMVQHGKRLKNEAPVAW